MARSKRVILSEDEFEKVVRDAFQAGVADASNDMSDAPWIDGVPNENEYVQQALDARKKEAR